MIDVTFDPIELMMDEVAKGELQEACRARVEMAEARFPRILDHVSKSAAHLALVEDRFQDQEVKVAFIGYTRTLVANALALLARENDPAPLGLDDADKEAGT